MQCLSGGILDQVKSVKCATFTLVHITNIKIEVDLSKCMTPGWHKRYKHVMYYIVIYNKYGVDNNSLIPIT